MDGHQGDVADRRQAHRLARELHGAERQGVLLEHLLDGLEVEFGGHVHHREVFVVEAVVGVVIRCLPARRAHDLVAECRAMTVGVHRHEGGELQEAGIDQAAHALVLEAHALDHQAFELAHRHRRAEIRDLGRGGGGVDRAADQVDEQPDDQDRHQQPHLLEYLLLH